MKKLLAVALLLTLVTLGCTPVEKLAYNTIVAAKAFLDTTKSQHPECTTGAKGSLSTAVCVDLVKAVAAKDVLIDAAEVYCSSPAFDTGNGACSPPAKGTPSQQQALAKLQAAITAYNQTATDLKGVL